MKIKIIIAVIFIYVLNSCSDKGSHEVVDLNAEGDTIKITTLKGKVKDGPLFRFDSNNKRAVAEIYSNDTLMKKVYYYPNGIISSEGPVEKDQPHGLWLNYLEDGSLKSKINMNLGQPYGKIVQYHSNGKVEMIGEDVMGNGIYEMYDSLGEMTWKGVLEDGKAIDTLFFRGE